MAIHKRKKLPLPFLLAMMFFFKFSGPLPLALSDSIDENQDQNNSNSWYRDIDSQWGGHLKLRESISWLDHDSPYRLLDDDPLYDTGLSFRLKNKTYLGENIYFTTHYEILFSGGDTRKANHRLRQVLNDSALTDLFTNQSIEDDSRFLDLTKTIRENEHQIIYHRLDRFSATLQPHWGTIRIGRQAVTWGNGLVFNPMDLFNPFAPTDVERDYKVGDDMVFVQLPLNEMGDLQFLYVPRRDPVDRHLTWSRTSTAGKIHFSYGTTEFDFMIARHYRDIVYGLGFTGFLQNAVLRVDGVWNIIRDDMDQDDYLGLVANIDYPWVWWDKNIYGFIEFYYNGLGDTDYDEAIGNPEITKRISRGNLFVLGRKYLAAGIRIELHPLVQTQLNVIRNLSDASGIIQPQIIWDVAENFQFILGGNFHYGRSETEFGGFKLPGANIKFKHSDNLYLWLTYYF